MQGLLLLDKPQNITSFSAVSAVKRAAGEKRVGHTGTLDPMATGVLPILLGRATALSSLMLDADKRYIARIRLGIVTDTDDITGNIVSTHAVNLQKGALEEALKNFTGKISQIPPMYSAIKKDGVRLYTLAREGKTVEIPSRDIEVYELILLSEPNEDNEFEIEAHVSKGTYIRALARDIGEYLGVGATLTALRRTYASGFNIKECVLLSELNADNIGEYILSEETALMHLRELNVTEKQAVRFCNGGQLGFERIHIENIVPDELFRVKYGEKLLGVGYADNNKQQIAIKCIINNV